MPEWKDAPDAPGWWWLKEGPHYLAVCEMEEENGELTGFFSSSDGGSTWHISDFTGGRWYGPIPEPPKENSDD